MLPAMTQPQSQNLAPSVARPGATPAWRGWMLLWCLVAVCEALLLASNGRLDTWLWCSTRWAVGEVDGVKYNWKDYEKQHAAEVDRPFYMRVEPPFGSRFYHGTYRFWNVLRCFGEPWMVVIVLCVVAVYARGRWLSALAAGAGVGAAAGLAGLLSLVAGRIRPTHIDGANVWEFLRGFHNAKDMTFPSGHATAAFALAAVLCYLSPRGRVVFVTVAAGCAVSRVIMQSHFWGDVIPGAALGWTTGWAVMALLERLAARNAWLRKAAEQMGPA